MTEDSNGSEALSDSTDADNGGVDAGNGTEAKTSLTDVEPEAKGTADTEGHRDKEYEVRPDKKQEQKVDVSRPDDIPEEMWNEEKGTLVTDKALAQMQKLEKNAKDLRKKLSKGVDTPDKAADYAFEPNETARELNIDLDNEVIDKIKTIAHKNNLSQDQFNSFLNDYFSMLVSDGIVAKPLDEEAKKAQQEEFIKTERAKLGTEPDLLIRGVAGFLNKQLNIGAINEAEHAILKNFIDLGADNILVMEKIRKMTGEKAIPVLDAHVEGLASDDEIKRNWKSYTFEEQTDIMKKREKAGRPMYLPA